MGVLSEAGGVRAEDAITAKPCEIAAYRAYSSARDPYAERPLLLSFFCAGTPSLQGTDALLAALGWDSQLVPDDLWYRGRGWPGRFTVRRGDDIRGADYGTSWGRFLGPRTQWRCKICPDGVGESADVVAADYWHADEKGYPVFSETDGVSALIARTERGAAVVREAHAAGVLVLRPITLDALAAVQPLQSTRRNTLAARLLGASLAGRPGPHYRGFGLWWRSLRHPRLAVRTARGAHRRVKQAQAALEARDPRPDDV